MKTEDIYVLDNLADWELGNSYIKPLAALFSRLQGYMDTAPQALAEECLLIKPQPLVPTDFPGAYGKIIARKPQVTPHFSCGFSKDPSPLSMLTNHVGFR